MPFESLQRVILSFSVFLSDSDQIKYHDIRLRRAGGKIVYWADSNLKFINSFK